MDICGIIPNNIMENLVSECKGKKIEGIVDSMKSFITSGYDLKKILINQLTNYFTKDNSIIDEKKFKSFEILIDKDIVLCSKKSNEILGFDLLFKLIIFFYNKQFLFGF